jgi:hypothetical protein
VTAELQMSRDDLRRPLPLAYHPLYRFYEGGALTRQFRGLPERPDDWWSEDWVGSCTCAGNPDPDGRVQGLSTVDLPSGQVTLKSLAEAWPEDMGDASVLVKLLSRPARCRCTRTRRGPGPGGTSGRRSARPRRGSC